MIKISNQIMSLYKNFKSASDKSGSGSGSASMHAVPPPSSLGITGKAVYDSRRTATSSEKKPYSSLESITQFTSSQSLLGKRKICTEDDYFDDDDEQLSEQYKAVPGSPGPPTQNSQRHESDEEDPLDAFMAGIEQQVKKESVPKAVAKTVETKVELEAEKAVPKGVRTDIDDEDDEESYYRYMEENPNAGLRDDGSDVEMEYDEDGNPLPKRKKDIDPLPPIYHSEIEYEPFEKNFYVPHEEINALSEAQVHELRKTLGVKVSGPDPCKPVTSFAHFGFPEPLMKAIRRAEFTKPSSIQAQAVPVALSGRDLIGIAKTGSGKTAAFIWPLIVHIIDQRELKADDGPIGLILAPTRELSLQIYNESKKFGKAFNINVVCCYGGGSKWEQCKALEQGAEIIVATPGRIIDLVKMKATNLRRVTFLVLDEADRMFNMGFEPQVRSICNHVRPDRQTLLFSATFKKRIERLARDVLVDPIRIVQGDLNEANEDVAQFVHVFANQQSKWNWLLANLVKMLSEGTVLVFVTKKVDAETVLHNLIIKEYNCLLLHGDMDQADRNKVITQFKHKEADILVATDVAARGLDIPHIRNVVNYDIARDIDTHTHRIGRTGRAGEKGTAHTLILEKEKEFAGHLVRSLEGAGQEVPHDLMDLALKSSWFRSSRFKQGRGKRVTATYVGLGYKEKGDRRSSSAAVANFPAAAAASAVEHISSSSSGSGTNASASAGPATNRFAAMRDAFRSQYMSQFRASSDRTWEETVPAAGQFVAPATLSAGPQPASEDKKDKKKRSRWN